jgi:flagellar basal-body rod modification protein FlgD
MSVSPITSAAFAPSASNTTSNARVPIQTLGQDDFLKLLITQMTSQDPLNPQKDTDFIAQMAQFSALEQSRTMSSDMTNLRDQQQILQATDLIGRTVAVQKDKSTVISGVVSTVKIEAGTPKVVIDGQSYEMDKVITIAPTPVQVNP